METLPSFGRVGYGASGLMGVGDEQARQAILHAAFDAGVTHFDVARSYGLGHAEAVLGRFACGRRDRITITTKCGILAEPLVEAATLRAVSKVWHGAIGLMERRAQARNFHFSVAEVRDSVETSLHTLKVDYIDLLLMHELRAEDATDDLFAILESLVAAGKVRAFGVGSDFARLVGVAEVRPDLVRIAQFENSVLRPNLERAPTPVRLALTHQALSDSYAIVKAHLAASAETTVQVSQEVGADLAHPQTLSGLMLQYSLDSNPKGSVLFSSRSVRNVEANASLAQKRLFDAETVVRFATWVQASVADPTHDHASP